MVINVFMKKMDKIQKEYQKLNVMQINTTEKENYPPENNQRKKFE